MFSKAKFPHYWIILLLVFLLIINYGESLEVKSLEEYKQSSDYVEPSENIGGSLRNVAGRRRTGCNSKLPTGNDTFAEAAINGDKYRWKEILFYIDINFDKEQKNLIISALLEIQKHSCTDLGIIGNRAGNLADYIYIQRGGRNSGCSSHVGKRGGEQVLNLETPDCLQKDTVMHEVMHALGYWHEQSRPDRDQFVTIVPEFIVKKNIHNFDIEKSSLTFKLPYDQNSVMHYSEYDFSIDNIHRTIVAKNGLSVGSTGKLTETDIKKIKIITGCPLSNEIESHTAAGSTGCSVKYSNESGRCWRYCEGSSGPWCYTGKSCIGDEESCANMASCMSFSCFHADPGCVTSCPSPSSRRPLGEAGCSTWYKEDNGWCWKYCDRNIGEWCYTGKNCNDDQSICNSKAYCGGLSCSRGAAGCVESCSSNATYVPPRKPHGSTGCSTRFPEGKCWRYCIGQSGVWCYTGDNCVQNQDECAYKTLCSGYTCDAAQEGCVQDCP